MLSLFTIFALFGYCISGSSLHWTDKASHILKDIVENSQSDLLETSYSLASLKLISKDSTLKEIKAKLNKKRVCQSLEAKNFPMTPEHIFGLLAIDEQAGCKVFTSAVLEESMGQVKDFKGYYFYLRARESLGKKVMEEQRKSADSILSSLSESSSLSQIAFAYSIYALHWPSQIPQTLNDLIKTKLSGAALKMKSSHLFSQPAERHLNWVLFHAIYASGSSSTYFTNQETELQFMRRYLIEGMSDISPKSLYFCITARRVISSKAKLHFAPVAKMDTKSVESTSSQINIALEFLVDVPESFFKTITVQPSRVSCNAAESTMTLKSLKYVADGNYFVLIPSEVHQVTSGPSSCDLTLKITYSGDHSHASDTVLVMYSLVQIVKFGECVFTQSSSGSTFEHSLSFPNTIPADALRPLDASTKLRITVQIPSITRADIEKYHVAVSVSSASAAHQLSSILIFGLCKSKGSGAECSITLDSSKYKYSQVSVSNLAGPLLNLTLRLMDPLLKTEAPWYLGQVKSSLSVASEGSKNDIIASWSSEVKPSFFHVFPKPLKTPFSIISLVFTGCVFMISGGLILLWLCLGLPIFTEIVPKLFKSSLAMIFFSGFAAIFAIYLKFWINWNMFSTLKVLFPLIIFTSYIGNRMMAGK